MGRLMSSDFGRDSSRPDHCHRSGPCRTSFSFHPCEPCEHRNVHWRHGRPVGSVAPTEYPRCRARAIIGPCPETRGQVARRKPSIDDQRGACHRARIIAPQPCIRQVQRGPDHDAVMRIGGEAPGRRAHSQERCQHHGRLRVTATSDRHRRPTISCSSGSESLSCRRSPVTPLARQRQPAPRP
jgi:hypothetical protein